MALVTQTPERAFYAEFADVKRRLRALELRRLPLSWSAPTFENGWTNYGAPWREAAYTKDASGLVRLRGLVAGGTVDTTVFTLPAGYRPSVDELFSCDYGEPSGHGRIDVTTDGQVVAVVADNGYVTLSGVVFEADA